MMKSLLFAAFALSLIFMVSAQCDLNAVLTCSNDYASMVSKIKYCMQPAAIISIIHS